MMEPEDLGHMYREFTKPHKAFERHEEALCHKLAAVAFCHLTDKAKDLVQSAGDNPVLYSYGSDGTPMFLSEIY